jgi:ribosomal protein S18 acetylase RimI-like enzyme
MNIWLSEIDSDRFGAVIAKANVSPGDDIGSIESWCSVKRVAMLIVRCATEQLEVVQQLEQCGAKLMDTLVYYQKRDVALSRVSLPNGCRTRLATQGDADELKRLAIGAFSGFLGHYHADLRLARDACDMVYGSWAANSCLNKQVADDVLLIERDNVVAGFLTLKYKGTDTAEIILNAVDPQCQGMGLYSALVGLALNWTAERGLSKLIVSTQITNLAPQKVWCRYGFEPHSSFYTLHKWF